MGQFHQDNRRGTGFGPRLTGQKQENPMKNRIFNTLKAFSACALLAVSCLSAQSDHRITVNIPFDFVVKNQHMSAGTYDVTTDLVQSTVLIRGENSDSAAFALSFAAYAGTTPTQA